MGIFSDAFFGTSTLPPLPPPAPPSPEEAVKKPEARAKWVAEFNMQVRELIRSEIGPVNAWLREKELPLRFSTQYDDNGQKTERHLLVFCLLKGKEKTRLAEIKSTAKDMASVNVSQTDPKADALTKTLPRDYVLKELGLRARAQIKTLHPALEIKNPGA